MDHTEECTEQADPAKSTDELMTLGICRDALDKLNPAERRRCLMWLEARYPPSIFGPFQ
jgi:hypothetical protein